MNSDRELLEAAAKAAGLRITWGEKYRVGDDEVDCTDMPYAVSDSPDEAPVYWDPLTDDGDAFRLAVKLHFMITVSDDGTHCEGREIRGFLPYAFENEGVDPSAATRRAIVRAAAAMVTA